MCTQARQFDKTSAGRYNPSQIAFPQLLLLCLSHPSPLSLKSWYVSRGLKARVSFECDLKQHCCFAWVEKLYTLVCKHTCPLQFEIMYYSTLFTSNYLVNVRTLWQSIFKVIQPLHNFSEADKFVALWLSMGERKMMEGRQKRNANKITDKTIFLFSLKWILWQVWSFIHSFMYRLTIQI